jgi:thiamine biosynthesis lipoprotein
MIHLLRPLRPLLLALLASLLVGGCERTQPVHHTTFLAFGTLVDLSIVGVSKQQADEAARVIEEDFLKLHHEWHAWEEGTLERVNSQLQKGEPFKAPDVVLPLIELGRTLSLASDHLFNPAIGRLIDVWGFHKDNPDGNKPPEPEVIAELLAANPRMTDIHSDGPMLQCDNPAVRLDFGAFGKGYGINLAVGRLKEMGIGSAIVNAGGDLRAIGSRSGTPWRIAIRNPSGSGVLGMVEVSGDESVFTSGNYERHYTYQGKRYHHIIDPRTGYPAEGSASVTVIHPDAAVADAAATALFIAGPEHWHEVARGMCLQYVLLVDDKGIIHMNPEMEERVELLIDSAQIRLSPPLGLFVE